MSKKQNPKPLRLSKLFSGFCAGCKTLRWQNLLVLTVAGFINALGVALFLYPMKLYDSGISGLSMLLDQLTPPEFTLSLFLILINFPIFAFGAKKQGFAFTVYSLLAVGSYSLFSSLLMRSTGSDVSLVSPLVGDELLLCVIFGGLLSGVGSGLTIRFGGAMDGIDVLSVIFAKRLGLTLGSFVLIFNTLLYLCAGIVIHSWVLPLYSVLTYFGGSKTVDFVVEGISRSKCAMIVTTRADALSTALSENFHATGTIINAIGGYSKSEKQIIYFVVNQYQIYKLRTLVQEIDPGAYISLQDVTDIFTAEDK